MLLAFDTIYIGVVYLQLALGYTDTQYLLLLLLAKVLYLKALF